MHPQLHLGEQLIREHRYSLARDHFRSLVERTPRLTPDAMTLLYRHLLQPLSSAGLHVLVAELHTQLNHPEDALMLLEEAFEHWPEDGQIYDLLSKIHKRRGHHPIVLAICETAVANGIRDGVLITLLSQLYLSQNHIQKGIALYERLIHQDPDHAPFKQSLAQLYQRTGAYHQALMLYEDLIGMWPEQKQDILLQCDRILAAAPSDPDLLLSGTQICLKGCAPDKAALHIQALSTQFPERHDRTDALLKQALDVFPNTPELLLALSDLLVDRQEYIPATTHLQQLLLSEPAFAQAVIQRLETIVRLSPQSVLAHGLLTEHYLSVRDFPAARNHLSAITFSEHSPTEWIAKHVNRYETLHSDPELAPIQAGLQARILAQRNQWSMAHQTIRETLCRYPAHTALHGLLTSLYRQGLQYRIDHLSPGSVRERFQLGLLLLESGEIYPAIAQLQQITAEDPLRNRAQLLIGRCFVEANRFDLAVNQLSRTLQQVQGDDRLANAARYLSAMAHLNLGNVDTALHTFNTIFETDIHFPGISAAIDQARQLSFTEMKGKAIGILPTPQVRGHYALLAVSHSDHAADPASRNWVTLNFSQVHNSQGITYWFQDNPTAAEDAFKIALQLDMDSAIPYCNLAALAITNGNAPSAKEYLEAAKKRNHNLDTISALQGILCVSGEQWAEAEKCFSKALQLNSANGWVRLALGDAYHAQGLYTQALRQWQHAAAFAQITHLVAQRTRYLKPAAMLLDDWVLPNPTFFNFLSEFCP